MNGNAGAIFRLLILCAAGVGLGGALGPLRDSVLNDLRPRSRKRIAQLWRFGSWGTAIALIGITEVVRLGHSTNWHTWGDALVVASADVAVWYETSKRSQG